MLRVYQKLIVICIILIHGFSSYGQAKTTPTGEQNFEEYYSPKKILFYPNPATDVFFIEAPDSIKWLRYAVYDAHGNFKLNGYFSPQQHIREEIPISNFPKGVYLLIVDDGTNRKLQRFAKI